MFMLLHLIALQQLKTLFTNRPLHYGLHLRKHIWIWNCAYSLYLQLFTTFKKCTAIICVSNFLLFLMVNFFILTCGLYQVILNLVLTKAYFIFSVLVEKRIRREIQIFCLRYINWPCGFKIIHCILCDMSSSIISISCIYLKRATCILSFRNNQVC